MEAFNADITQPTPAKTCPKKGRRKRRRGKVRVEQLDGIDCDNNHRASKVGLDSQIKTKTKVCNQSWLDTFDAVNDSDKKNIKNCNKSEQSWLDALSLDSEETESDNLSNNNPETSIIDRNLNNYKQRFCLGSDKQAAQEWNNEKTVTKDLIPKIGVNVNNLNAGKRYDGTKRSRRKTEPFDFEKQADGSFKDVEIFDFEISHSAPNSWDIPNNLCNFMADGNDNSGKSDLDGKNLLSGCISGKGLFVPFKDFDGRLSREESLEKIFEDDYLDNLGKYDDDNIESDDEKSTDDEAENCDELYGALPPEPQLGNVEYKLKLVNPTKQRFEHLVTQMKWRLREGQGEALYEIGVRDCGRVRGLAPAEMRASLLTLRRMATRLGAACTLLGNRRLPDTKRSLAEVLVRKIPDDQHNIEVRVAVMGSNDAGKSTLIGVLTQGELDNGRGSARLNMFRHLHEVKTGRTSSVSHEILGFDLQGRPINYAYSELMTSEEINEHSSKLVSFIDLAGHRKYLKTTVQGLTGYSPHYAMLVVSATAGINQMTHEHLALVVALDLPFFVVVTKIDATSSDQVMKQLEQALKTIGCRKVPLSVLSMDDAVTAGSSAPSRLTVPVLPVSSVTGKGLDALRWFLFLAPPATIPTRFEQEPIEFQVDEIFKIGDVNGPIVGGLLKKGVLTEKTNLLIGPLDSGDFVPVSVNSLHRNKAPCRVVRAGQAASLGLSWLPPGLRQGMFLLAVPENFITMKTDDLQNLINNGSNAKLQLKLNEKFSPKYSKKFRRKKTANMVEDVNKKDSEDTSDSQLSEDETVKNMFENVNESGQNMQDFLDDVNWKEDLNNPRGCYFFQATVSLLNHSAAIYPGCQSTVHIGNIRQTAVIEGILSSDNALRANEDAPVLFRFMRHPEFVRTGERILFREALHTKGVGRVTQVFPHKDIIQTPCCERQVVSRQRRTTLCAAN